MGCGNFKLTLAACLLLPVLSLLCSGCNRDVTDLSTLGGDCKVALHVHTSKSDGRASAAEMREEYRRKGFQWVVITDHNQVSNDEISGVEKSTPSGDMVVIDGTYRIIAHPNYESLLWSEEELRNTAFSAMEIYNGIVSNKNAEDKWDNVLGHGKRVCGVAVDDAHDVAHIGRAWIQVNSETCTAEDVIRALWNCDFYSTTGAAPGNPGNTVKVIEGKGYTRIRETAPDGTVAWLNPKY